MEVPLLHFRVNSHMALHSFKSFHNRKKFKENRNKITKAKSYAQTQEIKDAYVNAHIQCRVCKDKSKFGNNLDRDVGS